MRHALVAVLVLASSLRAADAPDALKKLNVVALDAKGQPVTDLTAADLQVFDDGKPQPILFCRFAGARASQNTLAPREYSNRSAVPHDPIVILFDMLNDRIMGDAFVHSELVSGLKDLESADNVYLYLLSPAGKLVSIHPMPPADAVVEPESAPWTRDIATILDQATKPFVAFHPVDELDLKNRYQDTTSAIATLGESMTGMGGRRSLIWITHGFGISGYSISVRERIDFTDPLRNFFERLALSQIFIYPVDQSRRGAGADPTTYSAQTLDEAAAITGGRRLTSDRASDAIQSTLIDDRADYEIAFPLPSDKVDKKRHKIRITTTRKDVRIQSEQAYYNLAPPSPDTLLHNAIDTAIHSPFDATDIGIRASLTPVSGNQGFTLNAYIDPADLLLRPSGDDQTGHVDVLIAAYDSTGLQQVSKLVPFNLKLSAQQIANARRTGGLALHQNFVFKDSTRRIRVIVYDPNLDAVGSVQVPLKAGE